jgi:hypothetical protein
MKDEPERREEWRNFRGCLVKAEHLEASSDGEKEDRRREENAYLMVC